MNKDGYKVGDVVLTTRGFGLVAQITSREHYLLIRFHDGVKAWYDQSEVEPTRLGPEPKDLIDSRPLPSGTVDGKPVRVGTANLKTLPYVYVEMDRSYAYSQHDLNRTDRDSYLGLARSLEDARTLARIWAEIVARWDEISAE